MHRFARSLAALAFAAAAAAAAPALAADSPLPDRKPAEDAAPSSARAESPECAFTGKRVMSLLARDDVVAATEFHQFYTAFECPAPRLAAAFGCAVDAQDDTEEPANDRVERCWAEPSSRPAPDAAPAAGEEQPADTGAEAAAEAPPAEAADAPVPAAAAQ